MINVIAVTVFYLNDVCIRVIRMGASLYNVKQARRGGMLNVKLYIYFAQNNIF